MKVILANKTAELVEKKSRFIANIFYAKDEKTAEEKILEIKKKYYDAKHNVYAYIIGKNAESVKSSDDGEPSGTAGHPMLDILKGYELTNIVSVVTRYFGGILLGTGGLVRAYSDSLKLALKNASFSDIRFGYTCDFELDYEEYGKIERLIMKINDGSMYNKISELKKEFLDKVKLSYIIEKDSFDIFSKELIDITKGKIKIEDNESKDYYMDDGHIIYL